jgi:heat shock protein HtpX
MVSALAFNSFHVKHWWTNLISDHPTLDRRIDRLEHTADLPE